MVNSNDTIGNLNRDLPTCSTVPQPTAPPCALPPSGAKINNARRYGSTLPCIGGVVLSSPLGFGSIWNQTMFSTTTTTTGRPYKAHSRHVRRQISPTYTTYDNKTACVSGFCWSWSATPITFTSHAWKELRPKHSPYNVRRCSGHATLGMLQTCLSKLQAVPWLGRQPSTSTENWARSQASQSEICGGRNSNNGTGFSHCTSF